MRYEDLEDALVRAHALAAPLAAEHRRLTDLKKELEGRRAKLEAKSDGIDYMEHARISRQLFGVLIQLGLLAPSLKEATGLVEILKNLIGTPWVVGLPGRATGTTCFFVRGHRIEDGKPVAYDPFWIETACKGLDTPDGQDGLELHRLWQAGLPLKLPGKTEVSPPWIGVAKPFGLETEAERVACRVCAGTAYVVGRKEFPGKGSSSSHLNIQALYALCLACPRLTILAERFDKGSVRLHP